MTRSQNDKTPPPGLRLAVLPETFGICRMSPKARIPKWIHDSSFYSISRSPGELSLICDQQVVPDGVKCEGDWRAFKVVGTLDMTLMGVLAALSLPLAENRIGLITISTFETDYMLVRAKKLAKAVDVLTRAGHVFEEPTGGQAPEATATETPAAPAPVEQPSTEEALPEADDAGPEALSADAEEETPKPRRRRSRRRSGRRRSDSDDSSEAATESAEPEERAAASEEPEVEERTEPSEESAPPVSAPGLLPPIPGLPPLPALVRDGNPAEEVRHSAPLAAEVTEELDPVQLQREALRGGAVTEELDPARLKELQEQMAAAENPQSLVTEEISVGDLAADGLDVGSLLARRKSGDELSETATVSSTANAPAEATSPSSDEEPGPSPSPTGELPADEADPVSDDDPVADGLFTGAIPQNPVETTEDSFESLGISPGLIETLEGIGFTHPTPIQAAVIPIALEGGDLIGLAETGSGKTAAFGLPLAERLTHGQGLRGLILCPTREIALQTKAFLDIFGKEHDLETAVIIGGVKFGPQLQALRRKPDIIVATPGRLADHLRRGNVRLDKLEELVLDEADHMLDLGFLPQIQEILESIPDNRRTLMFSATMPPAIERLAQRFLNDPYTADLRPVNRVAAGIRHRLYLVKDGDQKNCLIHLLEQEQGTTLIFARRKLDTEWLARQLEIAGLPVDRIHSDRSQSQRVRALRTFREGKIRILVATDVAARGIDVPQLSHVVNFGLPDTLEDYVHRAGRTARGKAVGTVSSIGTWLDKTMVKDIERLIGHEIERCEVEGVDAYKELRPKRKTLRRRLL